MTPRISPIARASRPESAERRSRTRARNATRWTHVRYKGSINFEPSIGGGKGCAVAPDRGDEARLLSSFLGWLIGISASNYRRSPSSTEQAASDARGYG